MAVSALSRHNCSSDCQVREVDVHVARLPRRASEKRRERERHATDMNNKEQEDIAFWKDAWPQVEDEHSLEEVITLLLPRCDHTHCKHRY